MHGSPKKQLSSTALVVGHARASSKDASPLLGRIGGFFHRCYLSNKSPVQFSVEAGSFVIDPAIFRA